MRVPLSPEQKERSLPKLETARQWLEREMGLAPHLRNQEQIDHTASYIERLEDAIENGYEDPNATED